MRNLISFASLFLLLTAVSKADTILYDSGGFEAFNVGALAGQDGWATDNNQNYVIQNALANGGNLAAAITSVGTTDWAYPAPIGGAGFIPAANELLVIEADLARTISATPSFSFGIDVYDPAFARILRFGLHSSGVALYNQPSGTTFTSIAFNENEFMSFRAELNFAANTYELFINGTSLTGANDIAFASPATSFREADFQISTGAGATDTGFLDNYRVSTVTAIPEPGSLAMVGFTVLAFCFRRCRAGGLG